MILTVPKAQVSQLTSLVALIPDELGTNAMLMQQFGSGLLPACRVNGYYEENELVGYIMYEIGGHVYQLAVEPLCRQNGIGRALIDHAMVKQTCAVQSLHVRSDNDCAINFYRTLGFIEAGEVVVERCGNEFIKFNRRKL